ncbi:MAG TPA: ASKHA domain-containing protein [Candidatus Humimicrobiaceae bacterium]
MSDKKIKINIQPIGKRILLEKCANGLESIADAGIKIKSVCAGKGTCGKCRIIIFKKEKKQVNKKELEILTLDEIKSGVRLACQQVFDRDLTIYIPSSSLSEEQKLQVTGEEKSIKSPDPVCKKYFIKLKETDSGDTQADYERIKSALKEKYKVRVGSIDNKVFAEMPSVIRNNLLEITVTVRNNEIILIEGRDKTKNNHGLAVDLGTTKIAIFLVDLVTGETVDSKGIINPQIIYGEDVMSRLNFAIQNKDNADKIQKIVIDKINEATVEICSKNDLTNREITEMTVVGNTAMLHLLLKLPAKQLGLSPFVSSIKKSLNIKAGDIGIKITAGGYIFLPPPIAGFIGSDHLAMILATKIYKRKGNYLGIDIGTNTEIALKTGKEITSVSTASGPAFEGAHIKHGMRASPGAIERVMIDPGTGLPSIQTIDDKEPVGICGSGILDAVAALLKVGLIDKKGKFKTDSDNICRNDKGELSYVLAPSGSSRNKREDKSIPLTDSSFVSRCGEKDISISQKDIVEIQLAKGAIRAGIEILLEHAGISIKEIDGVILSGAFGSYIDAKNVMDIGMFPGVPLKKIRQVGNAAGVGAKMILISKKQRIDAERIVKKINYLELASYPGFDDHFINGMQLP